MRSLDKKALELVGHIYRRLNQGRRAKELTVEAANLFNAIPDQKDSVSCGPICVNIVQCVLEAFAKNPIATIRFLENSQESPQAISFPAEWDVVGLRKMIFEWSNYVEFSDDGFGDDTTCMEIHGIDYMSDLVVAHHRKVNNTTSLPNGPLFMDMTSSASENAEPLLILTDNPITTEPASASTTPISQAENR